MVVSKFGEVAVKNVATPRGGAGSIVVSEKEPEIVAFLVVGGSVIVKGLGEGLDGMGEESESKTLFASVGRLWFIICDIGRAIAWERSVEGERD